MNRPISETIRIEDMRLFAQLAERQSFTAAAAALELPKQTLSRRIAQLERSLGVQLLLRTTRRIQLTDAGASYAERCAEIVRLATEANKAVADAQQTPRGLLRLTADPVLGESFVSDVVLEYARRWPEVQLEVVLTRRKVDLIDERFDLAFRVGALEGAGVRARKLGPARVRYCASPGYLRAHGTPKSPKDLVRHECLLVVTEGVPTRWPFRSRRAEGGMEVLPVNGRLRFSSFEMMRAAALKGLGIGLFPEFRCAEDVRRGQLVPVLERSTVEAGAIWLMYPSSRFLAPRVRKFIDLAAERFAAMRSSM